MSRLAYGAFGANSIQADGFTLVNVPTIVTSPFTGGGPYALQVVGTTAQVLATYAQTLVAGRSYYMRARVRISGTPTTTTLLLGFGVNTTTATATNFGVGLVAGTRDVRLWAGSARGAVGPTLAVNTDYLLEVQAIYDPAGSGNDTIAVRVDGVLVDTFTGAIILGPAGGIFLGLSPNAGITAHYTDWAVNDDQGGNNNSWCADARTAMLLPVSDDAPNSTISADAWRAGNTGTTNLFAAVDNAPPTGATSPGTTVSQIVCDTPSVARNYVVVTAAYSTQIAAGDTINVVQGIVAHGESISTGTKTGTCDLFANPAGSVSGSFNYGNDAGAAGAFPTLWTSTRTPPVIAPTPTLASGASIQVTAAVATRNVDVCFMGAYIDYTPAVVTAATAPPPFQRRWRYLPQRRAR